MVDVAEAVLTIENELGLHARAATLFVQVASGFEAEVLVRKDDKEINGKSIMGVLTLMAGKGAKLLVRTEGPDAAEALEALKKLVADKLGENR